LVQIVNMCLASQFFVYNYCILFAATGIYLVPRNGKYIDN